MGAKIKINLMNRATHQGVFKKRLGVLPQTPKGFASNALAFHLVLEIRCKICQICNECISV